MNQQNSNSQYQSKLLRIILSVVFILSAVLFINPINAYAKVDTSKSKYEMSGHTTGTLEVFEEDEFNGEKAEGQTYKPSYLYWAGTTDRTGYLMYFVDTYDGHILTETELGLPTNENNDTFGVQLLYEDSDEWLEQLTDKVYITHFGDISNVKDTPLSYEMASIPEPVGVAEGGGWKPNSQALFNWLFSTYDELDILGEKIIIHNWEQLLRQCFPTMRYSEFNNKVLTKFRENPTYSIVMEPLAAQAVYARNTWKQSELNGNNYMKITWSESSKDKNGNVVTITRSGYKFKTTFPSNADYVFYQGACKPLLTNGGTDVMKVLTTGMYAAEFSRLKNEEILGINITSGEHNSLWLHTTLPTCMSLDEPIVIEETNHQIKATDGKSKEISLKNVYVADNKVQDNGYSMVVFNRAINYINTYDVDKNPKEPYPSQEPDEGDDTAGECTIVKLYYDKYIDYRLGTIKTTLTKEFETNNATGYIKLTPEQGVNGGYAISGYLLSINKLADFNSKKGNYDAMMSKVKTSPISGLNVQNEKIFKLHNTKSGEEGRRKYIYIIYLKTTHSEQADIKDFDFEIPESYITKQVWFSQANATSHTSNGDRSALKFTAHNFEWTADKFKCAGHEIMISCGKPYHPVHNYTYGGELHSFLGYTCLVPWAMYDCDGDGNYSDYYACNKAEHTHGRECFESEVGIYCTVCFAIATESGADGTYELNHTKKCAAYSQNHNTNKQTDIQLQSLETYKYKTHSGISVRYLVPVYTYKDPSFAIHCSKCGVDIIVKDYSKNRVVQLVESLTHSDEGSNVGKYVFAPDIEMLRNAYMNHVENLTEGGKAQHSSNVPNHILFTSMGCGTQEHKHVVKNEPVYTMPPGGCDIEEHFCLLSGCIGKTEKVYCTPSLSQSLVKFKLKNTLQSSYPNIVANTGVVVDGITTVLVNQSAIDLINSSYKWVSHFRTETGNDTTKDANIKFDYSTILLRGDDKLTLAQWKTENAAAISNLQALTNQFYVGNVPHTDERKPGQYEVNFGAKFDNDSSDADLTTKAEFAPNSDYRGELEIKSHKVFTIPIINIDIELPEFITYGNNICNEQSKVYTLKTSYSIPTIKVKVNVFSDYTNQNPGTPIHGDTTISFYPYVRMYYDTPTLKNQSALVLGETQRHFQAHDGADITFTNGTGQLTINTSQWYLAKMI